MPKRTINRRERERRRRARRKRMHKMHKYTLLYLDAEAGFLDLIRFDPCRTKYGYKIIHKLKHLKRKTEWEIKALEDLEYRSNKRDYYNETIVSLMAVFGGFGTEEDLSHLQSIYGKKFEGAKDLGMKEIDEFHLENSKPTRIFCLNLKQNK